jgi:hypothetical protein
MQGRRLSIVLPPETCAKVIALAHEDGLRPADWIRSVVMHHIVFRRGVEWEPPVIEEYVPPARDGPATTKEILADANDAEPDPDTLALLDSLLGGGD